MARRSKGSAAKRVGQKARDRREAQRKESQNAPRPIAGESGRGSRVEPEGDRLILILPRAGEPEREDLTFLQEVPGLMPMLAEGVRRYCEEDVTVRTRREFTNNLRRYFVPYLAQGVSPSLSPLDLLDDALWAGFINFLNQPKPNGEPLEVNTRASGLGTVRSTLEALRTDADWADIADSILAYVPKNPWPGRNRKKSPVPVVPLDQFDAIVLAADAEFARMRERRKEGEQLLVEGRERLAEGARDFRQDKALCLAALAERYPDIPPRLSGIMADDRSLGSGVQAHGANTLGQYLYVFARDLVPLVLLLAARTSFNPDVVLGLCWSDLRNWQTMDGRYTTCLSPHKGRSNNEQIKWLDPETDAPDGLYALFDLIEAMTARLRPGLPHDQCDRMFVFMPQNKSKTPKAFRANAGASGGNPWRWGLNHFIQNNNLQTFTLQQLRPTRGSEIFEATGDLMASRAELGHRSTRTTWTHYTSDAARRRQVERVGQVLLVRERWRATEGQIDPRGDKPDAGAATPGFLCLNPHDSPRPGQVKGRPCRAYGECAACPLAGVLNEATAAAQYLGVREAIMAAQQSMAPQTWVAKWAPILAEHDAMLAALDRDILERARQIKLTYPAVG